MTIVSDEFARAMVSLAEAYGTVTLTAERIQIYAAALDDLPVAQVRLAMQRAVKECKFFPTVAELRSFVEPSVDDAAIVAWSGLQQAARVVGSYGSLVVDGATGDALTLVFGSWPAFCQTEDGPELAAKKAEFLAAHRQSQRRPSTNGRLLQGICQAENGTGSDIPVPVGRLLKSGEIDMTERPVAQRRLTE